MLDNFWHWFVIIGSIANILACWWLLRWSSKTKVNSDNDTTGHTWDEDLQELTSLTSPFCRTIMGSAGSGSVWR